MANFSFTVDTDEMAHSINQVSHHVDGVTTAVVAMQTAVVLTEKEGAERICRNVDQGFYSLIRSQISQKIANLRSKVDSRIMELRQQSLFLTSIKTRMERDFNMIANRYTKLFKSLDAALYSRVLDLDKAAMNLSNKDMLQISLRTQTMQATVPMHQVETITTSQKIAASQVKANADRAIKAMDRFILDSTQQKHLVGRILGDDRADTNGTFHLPIVIFESDSLHTSQTQWDYRMPGAPDMILAGKLDRAVQNSILNDMPRLPWSEVHGGEKERIANEFRRKVEQAPVSARVRAQIMRLFKDSPWRELERTGA